jgi:predicted Zn-dependent protease with MMP-like domain
MARNPAEMRELVRRVVIHEVGHYFGLSDPELHELERQSLEADRARQRVGPEPE